MGDTFIIMYRCSGSRALYLVNGCVLYHLIGLKDNASEPRDSAGVLQTGNPLTYRTTYQRCPVLSVLIGCVLRVLFQDSFSRLEDRFTDTCVQEFNN